MNSARLFAELLRYVAETAADRARPLPPSLARRSFAWAGGGVGPEPPVADDAPPDEGAARAAATT